MKQSLVALVAAGLIGVFGFVSASKPAFAVEVSVRTGVIKGDGSIIPVARRQFILQPWTGNQRELYEATAKKHGLGQPPQQDAYRKTRISPDNNKIITYTDEAFLRDYQAWHQRVKEKVDEAQALIGRKPIIFQTDLGGSATVEIPEGNWYVVGNYQDSFSYLNWNYPVRISRDTRLIELSNDNAAPDNELLGLEPEILPETSEPTEQAKFVQNLAVSFLAVASGVLLVAFLVTQQQSKSSSYSRY